MSAAELHGWHQRFGVEFMVVNGVETAAGYGNVLHEHGFLTGTAGLLDLSSRGRLCVLGADRVRFLNGQVTNNVQALKAGGGCYAAITTAKGKLESDVFIFQLERELLLDFEPGYSDKVKARLEKYIIADDVQVVDASSQYGLLSAQGPKALEAAAAAGFEVGGEAMVLETRKDDSGNELYWGKHARLGTEGVDFFVAAGSLEAVAEKLRVACQGVAGGLAGWRAFEVARIEAGIPRFGADMDETNLPPEAGLEGRAIHYNKGCYIGQEVMARIRTYGQVAKTLRILRLDDALGALPAKGDKLVHQDKDAGYITSAVASLASGKKMALAYVRRESNQIGTELVLKTRSGDSTARVAGFPFEKNFT